MDSVELCAGAGGQALGLEQAGFRHLALVEIDAACRATLHLNRPLWNVGEGRAADVTGFDGTPYRGVDLLAGGLPCPPFSVAGKQLGAADERNLFPDMLRIVDECRPRAILIENVRGFLDAVFADYRCTLKHALALMGYETDWRLFNASDFGVPQLRPRVMIVAVRSELRDGFRWPEPLPNRPPTVGQTLSDLMAQGGWPGAEAWAKGADEVAPTIVGGSKKHGGPDLGPSRARRAWEQLGVNGKTVADAPPRPGPCRASAPDGQNGCKVAGFSRRLAFSRAQDLGLSAGGQRIPAAGCRRHRGKPAKCTHRAQTACGRRSWLRRKLETARGTNCVRTSWPTSGE